MANVLNKTTLEYLVSVHTPDYLDGKWLINPKLPKCDRKYWIVQGDELLEMTAEEKAQVDADEAAAKQAAEDEAAKELMVRTKEREIAIVALVKEGKLTQEEADELLAKEISLEP